MKTLLTSKRVWIALFTFAADVAIMFGVDSELAMTFVTLLTALSGVLIAAITGTDIANAKSMPEGHDHKGRRVTAAATPITVEADKDTEEKE